jgi:hypothetical protein
VNTAPVYQIPTNASGLPLISREEADALIELGAAHEQLRAVLKRCSAAPTLELPWHINQDLKHARERLAAARRSAYLTTRSAA